MAMTNKEIRNYGFIEEVRASIYGKRGRNITRSLEKIMKSSPETFEVLKAHLEMRGPGSDFWDVLIELRNGIKYLTSIFGVEEMSNISSRKLEMMAKFTIWALDKGELLWAKEIKYYTYKCDTWKEAVVRYYASQQKCKWAMEEVKNYPGREDRMFEYLENGGILYELNSNINPIFAPEVSMYGLVEAIRGRLDMPDIPKKTCATIAQTEGKNLWEVQRNILPEVNIPSTWDSWKLVEWAIDKFKKCPAQMNKIRVIHGPAGREITFTYRGELDRLRGEDLINGIKTKPEKAFEAAAERIKRSANKKFSNAPIWRNNLKKVGSIRQLLTPGDIVAEGDAMKHCCGTYVTACQKGVTSLWHVGDKAPLGATIEVSREGNIHQVMAMENAYPESFIWEEVENFRKVNNLKWKLTYQRLPENLI